MPQLILASASPRRRELLAMLGLDFEVMPAPSEEEPDLSLPTDEAIAAVAGYISIISPAYCFAVSLSPL